MRKHFTFDTNDRGVELIKAMEGFRATPYTCPAGVWTWGYGTTEAAGYRMSEIRFPLFQREAEAMLRDSLDRLYEPAIERAVTVPLTSNQASALASFVYNVGPGAFLRSTLLRRLNAGDYQGAADALLDWVYAAGKVLPGLQKRRRLERDLFLEPDGRTDHEALLSAVRRIIGGDPMAQKVEPRPLAPLHALPEPPYGVGARVTVDPVGRR